MGNCRIDISNDTMTINVFTLTSPIHDKKAIGIETERFLGSIAAPDTQMQLQSDFSAYGKAELDLIYVRTGGTEGLFRKVWESGVLQGQPVRLLTSGKSNSLAASIEILTWLRAQGADGEILHGEESYISRRIRTLAKSEEVRRTLNGQRAGIIGKPSDWLIASQADAEKVRTRWGIELVEIPMEELLEEYRKHDYPIAARRRVKTCPSDYFVGALELYGAIRRIVDKHRLDALTVRCFDLLTTVKNTGCLALALLNEEGIPSSCEGDVPALLTMMLSRALTGQSGFQANPARINPETGEVLFAHCTVPLNMVKDYHWDTHFESGIGVAIHGELPTGDATLLKVSGDLERWFAEDVTLVRNQYEDQLCRTQVVLQTHDAARYLLNDPIGNHHVIVSGHHAEAVQAVMER